MTLTHADAVRAATLTVTDLSVSFSDPDGGLVEVLGPLSFSAAPGQFVCLVGRSGSGKTSVLRQLLRLSVPAAGTVSWGGRDVAEMTAGEAADLRRTTVTYVDQGSSLVDELTVLENTLLPLLPEGRARVRESAGHARELLRRFGLGTRLRWRPTELSGGERQRVGLARAMVARAPGIVTDEPTSSLDRRWADDVTAALREHADSGGLVVAASHDPGLAAAADLTIRLGES